MADSRERSASNGMGGLLSNTDLQSAVTLLYTRMGHTITAAEHRSPDTCDLFISASNGEAWIARCVSGPSLRSHHVSTFIDILRLHKADKAAILTLGKVPPEVKVSATQNGLEVVDGPLLFQYLEQMGITLSSQDSSADQASIHETSEPSSKDRRKPVIIGAWILAVIFLCPGIAAMISLISSGYALPRNGSPGCDLAKAIEFEHLTIQVEENIVVLAAEFISSPESSDALLIQEALDHAQRWLEVLEDPTRVPDCYASLLSETLRLNTKSAKHYVNALLLIRGSEYSGAQTELDLGIDASNKAGEAFLDAVCQFDVGQIDKTASFTCGERR